MFTPQGKGWSLTPRATGKNGSVPSSARSAGGGAFAKGKGTVASEAPPPPQASLGDNGAELPWGGGDVEVWRRFKEEGLLDEAVLEKKGREALVQRIAKLESELYDYQYNMGLLLLEKKEWTSKYGELRQGLLEAEEILKREQTAHVIALSEVEKREENLKKALGVEKQCVMDLEKALREMRAEYAEVKFTSDQKLAEAHSLMANIEEKSLEVEAKLRSADAKLAEASRKSSEIERKLLDVAARENIVQREQASLHAEKELHKDDVDRQREGLRAWERNLQEGQERLLESQSLLNQREKKANEKDEALKKKEKELEVAREIIGKTNNSLKEKENDVNIRLASLDVKEKEIGRKKDNLEKKEKDLRAIEEKLNARERVEMQKLLDDHNAILDSKKHEFEMEMEKKRDSLDEELKDKLVAVQTKEDAIEHKEEKLAKREQALEKKIEKLKEEQKDLDVKSKSLKKWEAVLKSDEKDLELKNKQLAEEREQLLISKADLETERATVEAEKQHLVTEKENLSVTEAERAEHVLLQSKLKQEIDECRILKESLEKEHEDLRQERENFEREWEVLDEKRVTLTADLKQVKDEKERLEKWRHGEEERLKREHLDAKDLIQKQSDDLRLKKEDFERTMLHERSEVLEMLNRERADVTREYDLRKHDLEINIQKKLDEMENRFQNKEREFNEQRETELNHIKSLEEDAVSQMQKMRVEQKRFEREKQEFATQRKRLEEDQLEIQNDIDTLGTLSRNLKDQREEFIKEREHFLSVVEQYKTCKNCGVTITDSVLPSLLHSHEIEDPGDVLLPSLADGYLEDRLKAKKTEASPVPAGSPSVTSGGRMSWLRSCTKKIFNFSPGKRVEDSTETRVSQLVKEASGSEPEDEPEPSFAVASDSFDTQRVQSENRVRVMESSHGFDITRIESENGIGDIDGEPTILSVDEQAEREGLSFMPEEDSQSQVPKRKVGRSTKRSKRKIIKRTRSVQAVVEDAKVFLKETSEKTDDKANGETNDSLHNNEGSQGDSAPADRGITSVGQKRRLVHTSGVATSELEHEDSEALSESVSVGGRRKRHQTVAPGAQTPADKRYNFRRSTVASTAAASQALSDQTRGTKSGNRGRSPADNEVSKGVDEEGTSKHVPVDAPSASNNDGSMNMLQKTRVESIVEVHEVTSPKLVRCGRNEAHLETDDIVEVRSVEISNSSGEEGGVNGGDEVNRADPANASAEMDDDESESEGSQDGSDSERLNASVGKKLWNFFTT